MTSTGRSRPDLRSAVDLDAGRFEPLCPVCARPLTRQRDQESGRLDPRNVYAATKLHQEHLCASFARESRARVISLRYHNVYGSRMPRDTPYAGVASIFASTLASGGAPRVFEDGGQLRDFVHVRDVARANVAALCSDDVPSGPINVASGRPGASSRWPRRSSDAHGDHAPRPVVTGDYRLGDVRHVFASVARARDALGFAAQEDFAQGMAEFARAPLRAAA